MPAPAYAYDVFISYRRASKMKRWVRDIFYQKLHEELELDLGRAPRIFYDEAEIEEGALWRNTIPRALQSSACIVALLSKPYFGSKWCVAEWETFRRRGEIARSAGADSLLMLPIQWHDGESFPKSAREYLPADFRRFAVTSARFLDSELGLEYEQALRPLSEKLALRVVKAPAPDAGWPVIDPESVELATPPSAPWDYSLRATTSAIA